MRWINGLALSVAAIPVIAQAQAEPVRPAPPPPIMTIPAPAPVSRAEPLRETVMGVRVFGGEERLWDRELRLRGYGGAQVDFKLTQAAQQCGILTSRNWQGSRTGLELTVAQRGSGENTFTVTSKWTRAGTDCAQPGTYSVGLDVVVDVPPGQTRVLRGDGGLRIELTRAR